MDAKKDYFLGLDMGTSSVGWAVTDEKYQILRAKGKDMWGIREFEEADTSKERRVNRISRRRREKEKARIGMLRYYFSDEIDKVDPNFFTRLDNSKYFPEDKDEKVRSKYSLFNDTNYNDSDYYNEFPTIFHLRKELINNKEPHDVRLVFLALNNMFKHRGHFLNDNINDEVDVTAMQDLIIKFIDMSSEILGLHFISEIDENQVKAIFSRKDMSRTKKAESMSELFEVAKLPKESKAVANLLMKCICGLSVDLAKIFKIELESGKKADIDFSSAVYEEVIDEISEIIGEENFELVEIMKSIYDVGTLTSILGKSNYLSYARVDEYDKHSEDLRKLKDAVLKYVPEEYDDLFRKEIEGSYSAYVKSTNSGTIHNRRGVKGRKNTDLYLKIKKVFSDYLKEKEVVEILEDIANENFLPKQLTSSNGVIPNQVHLKEMKVILNNAKAYLPFLSEVDESGYSVAERIIKLFSFHMPYYIGPVSESVTSKGWAVRKESGTVYPWNLEKKIDITKTSEKFITNMIRKCTYLSGEKVMPKASLEYERYCVLNEINNIRICGKKIDVALKQDIFRDLFEKGKKVTRAALLKYLICRDKELTDSDISGIDKEINNSLSNYKKFAVIFGDKIKNDSCKSMVEGIVYYGTIFGDDKKRYKSILEEKYGNSLTPEEIKRITGMKFKDWGKLSKAFLELPGCDVETGEVTTLIRELWNTNYNLMELLTSDKYTFAQELENRKTKLEKNLSEFTFEDLDEYYFSAPVKRMIWQTLQIIKEIQKVNGVAPKTIFLEMTRTDEEKGDKGRKDSREKDLLSLYKSIKDDTHDWNELIKSEGVSGRLKSKKMYLYIKQMGRDIYTGKPIDIDLLMNDNIYDIDHIYPRQFTTDNNIENNLVLVNKQDNAKKTNIYPLDKSIRSNPVVRDLWKMLHDKKLMNDEKYYRLTRNEGFTEEEQVSFIARQLVETSQGTKGVADLLKYLLPETRIVYSKASNVSKFRDIYKLYKCRVLNDLHHAHDAYLNIVVGNVYDTKFTQNPINFIRNEYFRDKEKNHYNLDKMFEWNVVRGDKIAWIAEKQGDQGTIKTVKKMLGKATPLMTRMSFEGHGGIANATLYSADVATPGPYISLKSSDIRMSDVKKYGGFTSVSTAYYFLVEHEEKGKRIRTIECLPIYKKELVENMENGLYRYCKDDLKLTKPDIRIEKINFQSYFKVNDYGVYFSGRTEDRILLYNAVSLYFDFTWAKYVNEIEKMCSLEKNKANMTIIEKGRNEELYNLISEKLNHEFFNGRPGALITLIKNGKDIFKALDNYDQGYVLLQIIKAFSIGSITGVDLRLIGGASASGTMKISKKLNEKGSYYMINQSVTGLFENKIDLLTV